MTIADVFEFYVRRDAAEANGKEEPCTGCDKKLEAGESYSNYDAKVRAPHNLPKHIVLCQKCTYLVVGFRPPPPIQL
ncbi:MAG TPA: hypothetical protein VGP41_12265 [Candidatus Lustribacter sp.]|jgi:hypothetical protein|nr:hypothetical protein [Candidatus Lustribacter sp.]